MAGGLRFSEQDIAHLERAGARIRTPDKERAPVAAPAPVAPAVNHVVVDMAPLAEAIRESNDGMKTAVMEVITSTARMMAQAIASREPDDPRPAPIKSATATVIATDAVGNPSKVKFEFTR